MQFVLLYTVITSISIASFLRVKHIIIRFLISHILTCLLIEDIYIVTLFIDFKLVYAKVNREQMYPTMRRLEILEEIVRDRNDCEKDAKYSTPERTQIE